MQVQRPHANAFGKERLATASHQLFVFTASCYADLGQKIEAVAGLSLLATLAVEQGVFVVQSH
jgi:hypothetical protein